MHSLKEPLSQQKTWIHGRLCHHICRTRALVGADSIALACGMTRYLATSPEGEHSPPQTHRLTHSLNLRLWILGQLAPSGAREVSASLWISAPSSSSDWFSPAGEDHMEASAPPGASQKSRSQHSTCGAGAGRCHQGSQRHPHPPMQTGS